MIPNVEVVDWFGGIDVYLFDQLQKKRFTRNMRVLDAGCGNGRNIAFMLRSGYDVCGIDLDRAAVMRVRALARELAPQRRDGTFQVADIRYIPFGVGSFEVVVCNAVLHFAMGEREFDQMCDELFRVLRPGGYLFARLASNIGIEDRVTGCGDRRFVLPDGSTRFLVDEALLRTKTKQMGGTLFEPIKTVNVQGQRCMTTWCVQKV